MNVPTRENTASHGSRSPAAAAGHDALMAVAMGLPVRATNGPDFADPARAARIMIVDDEPVNIKVVRKYLQVAGYQQFITTTDSPQAYELMRREQPDVILLDVMMPQVDGLTILRTVRADPAIGHTPVIILTASTDAETKHNALDLGATDFLTKPVDPNDLIPRVRNALIVKAHQDHLKQYSRELEEAVRLRTAELEASRRDVTFCLARACEFRDDDTGHHVLRVGRFAGIIASELGFDRDKAAVLEQAAQLHDIGKIGVPDAILRKAGKLDPEEFEIIKKHCGFGKWVIQPVSGPELQQLKSHAAIGSRIMDATTSPVVALASRIALTHHEKWDGSGYPLGLSGEDIPIEGRITAVADVFDALSSSRPYKPAFPREKCLGIMEEQRGRHFDPKVLDGFQARINDVVAAQIEFADVA